MREMQATRQEILDILKRRGSASVDELARDLGLTSMCIRQHLSVLERDALVMSHEERQRLGRPRNIYALTERAEELFPRSYHLLLDWVLEEIEAMDGEDKIKQLVERLANRLYRQHAIEMNGKNLEEKVASLAGLLSNAGSLADWEKTADGYLLHEHNCRYHRVALRHRQICRLELLFLGKLFGTEVEMSECLLDEGPRCTYKIMSPA